MRILRYFLPWLCVAGLQAANPSFQSFPTNGGFYLTPSNTFYIGTGYIQNAVGAIGTNSARAIAESVVSTNKVSLSGFVSGTGSNNISTSLTSVGTNTVISIINAQGLNPTNGTTPSQVTNIVNSLAGTNSLDNKTGTNVGIFAPSYLSARPGGQSNRIYVLPTNRWDNLTDPQGRLVAISSTNLGDVLSQHTLTTTNANGFAKLIQGDQLTIGPVQFQVYFKVNDTNIVVCEQTAGAQHYVNNTNFFVNWSIFCVTDVNGEPTLVFGPDGSTYMKVSQYDNPGKWAYGMHLLSGTNSVDWDIDSAHSGGRGSRVVWRTFNNGYDPFGFSVLAGYESLNVLDSGLVSMRFGATNEFGPLVFKGPQNDLQGSTRVTALYSTNANFYPKTLTGGGTITLTSGSKAVTGAGTTFTSLVPGARIFAENTFFDVGEIMSDTLLTNVQAWGGNTTNTTWAYEMPAVIAHSINDGNFYGIINSKGDFGAYSFDTNNESIFRSYNQFSSWAFGAYKDNNGDYGITSEKPNSRPFSISWAAPNRSLRLSTNGMEVNVPIITPVIISSNLTASIITNTDFYFGPGSVTTITNWTGPTNAIDFSQPRIQTYAMNGDTAFTHATNTHLSGYETVIVKLSNTSGADHTNFVNVSWTSHDGGRWFIVSNNCIGVFSVDITPSINNTNVTFELDR